MFQMGVVVGCREFRTVPGGGGGGGYGTVRDGREGGSGGGAAADASGGAAVSGGLFGHAGGSATHPTGGGGGGGANAAGQSSSDPGRAWANGGTGWSGELATSYGLSAPGLAGGGGGGGASRGGTGPSGGGVGGSTIEHGGKPGGDATTYGSGGGGAGGTSNGVVNGYGGDGHAGVVAIRYPLASLPKLENLTAPQIDGVAVDGETLTVSDGTWDGPVAAAAYRWERCAADATGCQPIAGATANSYTLTFDDIGHRLRATVTVTPELGVDVEATSAPTDVVAAKDVIAETPTIRPEPHHGEVVLADPGTWSYSGGSIVFAYQWERHDGTTWQPITGQVGATYVPTLEDIGHDIRVQVTGLPEAGTPVTRYSPAHTVQPAWTIAGTVVVSGTPMEGQTLTVDVDEAGWRGSGEFTFEIEWRDCSDGCVVLGTGPTYVPGAADIGRRISVRVTGTPTHGAPGVVDIPESAPVAPKTVTAGVDEPELTVPDADALVTGQITVNGAHFLPHSQAEVWLHSDPVRLGTVTVSGDGTFSHTFALPGGIAGAHTVVVVGLGLDGQPRTVSTSVTIAHITPGAESPQPTGAATSAAPGSLARTGTTAATLLPASLIALLLGTALTRRLHRGRRATGM